MHYARFRRQILACYAVDPADATNTRLHIED